MWKWTDASQQIGVLQHKKKFKYTRKVGNRYYYDDQKPTTSISKDIPDNVTEFFKANAADLYDVGIPKENQHTAIDKNKDGSYSLTVTDKTNGKVMAKVNASRKELEEFNTGISTINKNTKGNNNSEQASIDKYVNRMASLNAQKLSNLTSKRR